MKGERWNQVQGLSHLVDAMGDECCPIESEEGGGCSLSIKVGPHGEREDTGERECKSSSYIGQVKDKRLHDLRCKHSVAKTNQDDPCY